MNDYYEIMIKSYNDCKMTKNIESRDAVLEYSIINKSRFLEYSEKAKCYDELNLPYTWKKYTEIKYKNIKASLRKGITKIEQKDFDTLTCGYCGQKKEERTIEHVLPQAKYPEFAIFVPNLICACGTCNGKKLAKIPKFNNENIYPHPRYELYEDIKIKITLSHEPGILMNETRIKYIGNDDIVKKWKLLSRDLHLNKRISDNIVKYSCDNIMKLRQNGVTVQEIITFYRDKIAMKDYSSHLELRILEGLIESLECFEGNLQA